MTRDTNLTKSGETKTSKVELDENGILRVSIRDCDIYTLKDAERDVALNRSIVGYTH